MSAGAPGDNHRRMAGTRISSGGRSEGLGLIDHYLWVSFR